MNALRFHVVRRPAVEARQGQQRWPVEILHVVEYGSACQCDWCAAIRRSLLGQEAQQEHGSAVPECDPGAGKPTKHTRGAA